MQSLPGVKPPALAEGRGGAFGWLPAAPPSLQAGRRGPGAHCRRNCLVRSYQAVRTGQPPVIDWKVCYPDDYADHEPGYKAPKGVFKDFVARPKDSGMHLGNAWSLANACALAYEKECYVEHVLDAWGLKGVPGEPKCIGYGDRSGPDTQCFVAAGDGFIVVVFRGTMTSQWEDIKNDIRVAMSTDGPPECRVHKGFLNGVLGECKQGEIKELIMDKVRRLQEQYGTRKPLAVHVTGHSLGAAESTLATAYMLQEPDLKDNVVANYTFGSPRVGDKAFRRKFVTSDGRNLTHRFQNRKDIVTHVPVWRPWWPYVHVGQWWYLSGDNQELVEGKGFGGWRKRMRDLFDVYWDGRADFVYDHNISSEGMPGGYVQGLKKNIDGGWPSVPSDH